MRKIIRVTMLLFLAAVLFIPVIPSSAQGQQLNHSKTKLTEISSSLKTTQEAPKKVIGKKSVLSYDDPNDYPLVKPGETAGTLIDSYSTTQEFTFLGVKDYSEDVMSVQLRYTCAYSYVKDPITTLEFFTNLNGQLEYLGSTEFDTSGYTNVNLNSLVDKEEYANDPYIYIRLGVSQSKNSLFYSDVVQFKVANPFYNPSSPGPGGGQGEHYVLISNESTDPDDFESTGISDDFKINNNRYAKNLKADDYKMDYVKPVDKGNLKKDPIRKSTRSVEPTYQLGDTKYFWVSNLINGNYYQIDAELLYSGAHALVWVNNGQISQSDAAKLGQEFDIRIYSKIHDNFGQESDVNGDGKINILVYDIQDGFSGYGGYIAGYFDPNDLYPSTHSNQSEIFYIDTYPLMGMWSTKDVTQAYDTLAHEFQHMVNFNENVLVEKHGQMDTWLDEGLAMAAEQIYKGQALDDRIDYYNHSDSIADGQSLLHWNDNNDTLANYSLSYLFVQYLKLQAGQGDKIFKEIIDDPNSDYKAAENIVKKYIDPNLSFGKFMTDFRAALLLKEKTGLYGFKGDPAFDAVQTPLYDGWFTFLYGGGALVKAIASPDTFTIPADKGPNITYTFLSTSTPSPAPLALTVNPVSDKDTAVTGSTEAGATVYVKIGSQTYHADADSSGRFSVSIPKQKAGTLITVYAMNAAGNKSDEVTVTVADKTPPATPNVNPVSDKDTAVTGSTEAGATVYVKIGSQTYHADADSSGRFSVSIPKQKAGTTLVVYATDAAGNKSDEVTVTVADKTPPATPSVNPVSDKDTAVTGSTEASATVYVKIGSQTYHANADSSGRFSVPIPKQKAGTTLVVYATDASDNKSDEVTVTVADKTPPATPSVNPVSDKDTSVTGSAEAGATVYVKIGSQTYRADADSSGRFSVPIPKQKAGTTLIVYATDAEGNKSGEVTVTIADKTPPDKPSVNTIGDNQLTISGKAEPGATVYAKTGNTILGQATASSKGDFTIKLKSKLKAGTTVTVYAVDKAGNKSTSATAKVVDKTPPAKPTVYTIGDNQLTISGKAEPGATVYVKTGSKTLGKVTASSKGTFSLKLKSKLKAGTVLTVYAVDKAGNKSASATAKVVDKTPPKTPSVNAITSKTTYVTGKGEYGSTVYVYYGSHYLGKATVQRNGTFKVKIAHQKKGRTLKIYAKDKAGNRSAYKYVKVK